MQKKKPVFGKCFLGKFKATDHALKQYDARSGSTEASIIRSICYNLRGLNVKKIVRTNVRGENHVHIFTFNYQEFIFVEKPWGYALKTYIKRNRKADNKAYRNRTKELVTA